MLHEDIVCSFSIRKILAQETVFKIGIFLNLNTTNILRLILSLLRSKMYLRSVFGQDILSAGITTVRFFQVLIWVAHLSGKEEGLAVSIVCGPMTITVFLIKLFSMVRRNIEPSSNIILSKKRIGCPYK